MKSKRILSMLLVVLLLVSTAPLVNAANTGSCGDNVYYEVDDTNHVVRIFGNGNMDDYTENFWSPFPTNTTKIIVESGVTSIGNRAFEDLTSLTSITLPDTLTKIGTKAFLNCSALTSVTIPGSVTDISSFAFEDTGLRSIIFEGDAPHIEMNAFTRVTANVTYPEGNVTWTADKVKSYGGNLTWPVVPYSGTCGDNLTWILGTDGVLTIYGSGDMKDLTYFQESPWWGLDLMDDIKKLVIEDGVTSIGDWAFMACDELTSITIPNSVTSIGDYAFSGVAATSITIPSSVTSIGDYAFEDSSLTSVTIPRSVTDCGEGLFRSCDSLTSATISTSFVPAKTFSSCYELASVTLSNSATSIGKYAFEDCYALTNITIPASVTSIDAGAFTHCGYLAEITFKGNAPTISDGSLSEEDAAFNGVKANAYYPGDNDTWTEDVRQNYGATRLTWVPYSAPSYSFSFDPDTAAIYKGETATVSLIVDTDVTVLAGTVTISVADNSGNKLDVTSITPNNIVGCEIDYEGSKILIATEGTIAAGTKIAEISFATNADTAAGEYIVTLVSDLYTGDMASDANDQKIDFIVNDGIISVSEVPVTVTWKDEDGTVLETDENVAYGSTPVYNGPTPKKDSTVQYEYDFNGWSPAVGAVTKDTFYTATYTETVRNYTLTFKNESGTTIETLTVPYGTEPGAITGIPAVPAKEATAEFTYTPNDWGVQTVTGDKTYTASYTANKNSYTITWKDADGSTLATTTVEYGQTPTYPTPSKDADVGYTYSFSNWNPTPVAVTGTATYQAVYSRTARTYTVSVAGLVDGAAVVLKDSAGTVVEPVDGKYALTYDQTYSYTINAVGYKPVASSFTVSSENSGLVFESGAGSAVLTFAAMEKFVGDMNNDGAITIADAQALYNYILDRYTLDNEGKAYYEGQLVFNLNVADVNNNGEVGSDDILPMLRLINASAGN